MANTIDPALATQFNAFLTAVTPAGTSLDAERLTIPMEYENPCEPDLQALTVVTVDTLTYSLGDPDVEHDAAWTPTTATNNNMICSWTYKIEGPASPDLSSFLKPTSDGGPDISTIIVTRSDLAGDHVLTITPVSPNGVDITASAATWTLTIIDPCEPANGMTVTPE